MCIRAHWCAIISPFSAEKKPNQTTNNLPLIFPSPEHQTSWRWLTRTISLTQRPCKSLSVSPSSPVLIVPKYLRPAVRVNWEGETLISHDRESCINDYSQTEYPDQTGKQKIPFFLLWFNQSSAELKGSGRHLTCESCFGMWYLYCCVSFIGGTSKHSTLPARTNTSFCVYQQKLQAEMRTGCKGLKKADFIVQTQACFLWLLVHGLLCYAAALCAPSATINTPKLARVRSSVLLLFYAIVAAVHAGSCCRQGRTWQLGAEASTGFLCFYGW